MLFKSANTLISAVSVFGEAFTFAHGVCFALVWTSIALMSAESILHRRQMALAGK